jgi:hypothetical protein
MTLTWVPGTSEETRPSSSQCTTRTVPWLTPLEGAHVDDLAVTGGEATPAQPAMGADRVLVETGTGRCPPRGHTAPSWCTRK